MSNSIGFEKANYYLNKVAGVEKVSGYRLTNTIEGIAVRSINGESSATDTASGAVVTTIKGTKEDLASALVKNGIIDSLIKMRSTEKYAELCSTFAKKLEDFKKNESKTTKTNSKSSSKSSTPAKKATTKVDFEIKKGTREGAFEVYFTSKPSRTVLDALKYIGFRWNCKKLCWYGFKDKATIEKAIKVA